MVVSEDAITAAIHDHYIELLARRKGISLEAARKLDARESQDIERERQFREKVFSLSGQIATLKDGPPIRADIVDRVKVAIAAGTYETDEVIDGAVAGVLEDLMDQVG
jgi:hypothetical protein